MAAVKYDDLREAFDFVSFGAPSEHRAFIALDTGRIYWVSELNPIDEEEMPEDLGEPDRYLEVPHKNNLDLGRNLVLRFIEAEMPEAYDRVRGFFSHRGAYARFKDFLSEAGRLEQWYEFETQRTDEALKEWCDEHQIQRLASPER
jgi:hypothetical protein